MLYNMCKVERFVLTVLKEEDYYYYKKERPRWKGGVEMGKEKGREV